MSSAHKEKRKSQYIGDHHISPDSGSLLKRRRKSVPEQDDNDDATLACIFHIAQPAIHYKCTKRFHFISQLQRHLQNNVHQWHACEKCFTRFRNQIELENHQNESDCVKRCRVPACRRHCLRDTPLANYECACITTSLEQWKCLFQLANPNLRIPAICPPPQPHMAQPLTGNLASTSHEEISSPCAANAPELKVIENLGASPLPLFDFGPFDQTHDQQAKIAPEGQVTELHSNLDQPSSRQRQVEALLAMVWEAFSRQEWQKAMPGSPLHRMVFELVPGVTNPQPVPGSFDLDAMDWPFPLQTSSA